MKNNSIRIQKDVTSEEARPPFTVIHTDEFGQTYKTHQCRTLTGVRDYLRRLNVSPEIHKDAVAELSKPEVGSFTFET
jgi:hypothetical protein